MAKSICGIYSIQNKINGKRYIGFACDIKRRWRTHKSELRHYRHCNKHLTMAWHKYGEENFEFSIIEECPRSELSEREKYWVAYYDTYENGYNGDRGGGNTIPPSKESIEKFTRRGEKSSRAKLTEKEVLEIIKRLKNAENMHQIANDYNVDYSAINSILVHKNWKHLTSDIVFPEYNNTKSIDVYTKDGQFVKTCPSIINASNEFKVYFSVISAICYGEKCTANGYIFRFHDHPFDEYRTVRNTVQMEPIKQYDLQWNLINTFMSVTEARQVTGINNISRVLTRHSHTAGGYYWLRLNESIPENGIINKSKCLPIDQYDNNLTFIKTYSSTVQASKETGICKSGINAVLHGRYKTSGGFIWRYHKEQSSINN